MTDQRLLGCFAHPDDEILGPGGTLAHYAANGTHVELVCATRGEAGEIADPALATPDTLAQVREQELLCSARTLGVKQVTFLDYRDSGMAGTEENQHPNAFMHAPAEAVVPRLVAVIRRLRPQVMMTFEPWGGYGHPDHLAIHRHTHAALEAAADAAYRPDLGDPWQVRRLFYELLPVRHFDEMKRRMEARGLDVSWHERMTERRKKGWPDDQVHCIMDVSATIEAKWAAFNCHRTQFGDGNLFRRLPAADMKEILSQEYFALAVPEPPPGLRLRDLFDGLV
ncbi:MAG: PIG-L family deacetylase [Anaerolineae bacterium]